MHKVHVQTIHTDGMGSAVHIPDVTSKNLAMNSEFSKSYSPTAAFPSFISELRRRPQESYTTDGGIRHALDVIGVAGLCIKAATNPGVTSYLANFEDCGQVEAGSVHTGWNYKSGIIVPTQLRAQQDQNAQLTYDAHILKTSGTDIVTVAHNVALPTIALPVEHFRNGPVRIGDLQIERTTGFTIDWRPTIDRIGFDGAVDPTVIQEISLEVEITITGINPAKFGTGVSEIPIGGVVATHANDYVSLRKTLGGASSGFYDDTAAQHIKFTLGGLASGTELFRGQARRAAEDTIIFRGVVDGAGTNPLVYTSQVALA